MGTDEVGAACAGRLAGDPGEERRPAAEDLERALAHCERLLHAVDNGRRRITLIRAVSAGLVALTVLAIVLSAAGSRGSISAWVAVTGALGTALIAALLSQWLTLDLREQVRRDEIIMIDVVGLQREILPLLARDGPWSPARLLLTQKRLERFPIEARPVRASRHRVFPR